MLINRARRTASKKAAPRNTCNSTPRLIGKWRVLAPLQTSLSPCIDRMEALRPMCNTLQEKAIKIMKPTTHEDDSAGG